MTDTTGDKAASESTSRGPLTSTIAGRPTWAEIDLDNLVHNFQLIRSVVGTAVAIMPAVKANAYGHGALRCAGALEGAGADWFGVALPTEGAALRDAGVTKPILCLAGYWDGDEELLIQRNLTPVIFREAQLDKLDRRLAAAGQRVDFHLKVDTGMGRLGVPFGELNQFLDAVARYSRLNLDGVLTHLASADLPEQRDFTSRQWDLFEAAVATVRDRGFHPRWIHGANGAAAHAFPAARCEPANLIRPGGLVYGLWRDVTDPTVAPLDLRPVLSLRARISHLKVVPPGTQLGYGGTFRTARVTNVATLPIGYADGISRALSNRGHVLVRESRVPIIGRVSMDLTLIDVTDIEGVKTGDDVVLIGRQGAQVINAEDVAIASGSISYEVTCRVGERVPRVYKQS
jgi:alanine racemase